MVRTLVALLLVVCLGMLLTIGASAQEPPGNQQIQSSAVREIALVGLGLLGGLLGGWGGAFISGWWSSKNLNKRLEHEAEQNRLSREEQRQQLTIQLIGQREMLRDQLEQQTREYMRGYRQQRVDEVFEMILAYELSIGDYQKGLVAGEPVDRSKVGVPHRLRWAVLFLGSPQLREKGSELIRVYNTLIDAIEKNPAEIPEKLHKTVATKISEWAGLAERYVASG